MFPAYSSLFPDVGSILASVEAASGRKATAIGKPNAPMVQFFNDSIPPEIARERIMMIGDSPVISYVFLPILLVFSLTSNLEYAAE